MPGSALVCDDGVFCNGVESCEPSSGCGSGVFPCDDGIACTLDGCDESSDDCSNTPDDTRCDDGAACNGEEQCSDQTGCTSGTAPDCDALTSECGIGLCSDADGGCVVDPVDDGTDCDEGNACTIDDMCAAGVCVRTSFCGVPISRGDKPTSTDALFALRTSVDLEECDVCECDVNGDGTTTVSDALTMLAGSVDLEVELACFSPGAAAAVESVR
jgi:hypothetical protein